MMRRLPPVKGKSGKSTISVANKRTDVSQYHDQGGTKAGQPPKREWFGISEVALDKIRTELGYRLAEKLRQRRQVITK